jgi:histidine ammonia-lyase
MIEIDGGSLTLEQTAAVADGAEVSLAPLAYKRIARARAFVEELIERREVVYGINTGFGALADVTISPDRLRELPVARLWDWRAAGPARGEGDDAPAGKRAVQGLLGMSSGGR